ncbi:hypothetical protein [Dyadobacter sp. 32]|uniref:hypothetical protein n=1 Tax=Dyadobacter sp. 32 TaxID=538966 RepID=UPI0011EC398F
MKVKAIKFFSPEENAPKIEKSVTKSKPKPAGYISGTGKLVFPVPVLEELGIEPDAAFFKIGSQQGKRTLKFLYLIPSSEQTDTFAMAKSGRGYVIPLAIILKKGGVDFEGTKYTFEVSLFNYEEGVTGYELAIISSEPKPAYTGKPRGRKPRAATVSE